MSKKDTIEGRLKVFVKKATDFSIVEVKKIIQVSLNKSAAKGLFEGLDENDENLQTSRKIFIETYVEFFINRNLQFLHLLQDLEDSWENAMVKLAKDAER